MAEKDSANVPFAPHSSVILREIARAGYLHAVLQCENTYKQALRRNRADAKLHVYPYITRHFPYFVRLKEPGMRISKGLRSPAIAVCHQGPFRQTTWIACLFLLVFDEWKQNQADAYPLVASIPA